MRRDPLPAVPWIALTAVAVIYAGVLLFVIPALEKQKVIPEIARWVASRAEPDTQVATYQLNRWNTAFRFYVDRHVTMLVDVEEIIDPVAFGLAAVLRVMPEKYDDLAQRGVPVKSVRAQHGAPGRCVAHAVSATRFVVVTSRDGTARQCDGVAARQSRSMIFPHS